MILSFLGIGDGGGKGALAYTIDHDFPDRPGEPHLFRRVSYDCKGRIFGRKSTWYTQNGTWKDGTPVEKVVGYGLLGHDFSDFSRHISDRRGLELLKQGCCPEAVVNAMLGDEGMPD